MRKLASHFVVMILAMQAFAAYAQFSEKTEPQFTLTISEVHSVFGPGLDRIDVKETNISKKVIIDPGCIGERGLASVSVLYNGVPLDEKDADRRRRREKYYSQYCTSGGGVNGIKPGEFQEFLVSVAFKYDVWKPGTYDITVTMESDPYHPEKSVTVKSNTITVVVPEPPLKLTLSENHDLGAGLDRVNVTETNMSDEDFVDRDNGCIRELSWFTVEVFYNGVPLKEKDIEARFRRRNETIDLLNQHKAPCDTGPLAIVLKPGESRKLWLGVSDIYDVTKPGSYDVYVSRETNPIGRINNEYVRSNTITVVVPEPEADAPKRKQPFAAHMLSTQQLARQWHRPPTTIPFPLPAP